MRFLRYGQPGRERPGLLDQHDRIRDLSDVVQDLTPETLTPTELDRLRSLDPEALPLVESPGRIGPCVADVSKVVCIGLNYKDHAEETGKPIPEEPILFMKATTSIAGPDDDIVLPKGSTKGDWEVELGIVIGSKAQYIDQRDWLDYVAGFCIVNDVSEREFQVERGGQWVKGKSSDTFCPMGPWLVTPDEVPDPQNLELTAEVSGEVMQSGSTKTMIFDCAYLVSYISQFMTLLPGDVIATGTPAGVGFGRQRFLRSGDTIRLSVAGLGEQNQRVVAYDEVAR
jgi:2-keto-4-pentenoate hydratase/2-oxohepta-3-ene-1,7-dioic acid hydratase in catechol pathway